MRRCHTFSPIGRGEGEAKCLSISQYNVALRAQLWFYNCLFLIKPGCAFLYVRMKGFVFLIRILFYILQNPFDI